MASYWQWNFIIHIANIFYLFITGEMYSRLYMCVCGGGCVSWDRVSFISNLLYSCRWPWMTFLPPSPECWDYRHKWCSAYIFLRNDWQEPLQIETALFFSFWAFLEEQKYWMQSHLLCLIVIGFLRKETHIWITCNSNISSSHFISF